MINKDTAQIITNFLENEFWETEFPQIKCSGPYYHNREINKDLNKALTVRIRKIYGNKDTFSR